MTLRYARVTRLRMSKKHLVNRSIRFEKIDLAVAKKMGLPVSDICRKAVKRELIRAVLSATGE